MAKIYHSPQLHKCFQEMKQNQKLFFAEYDNYHGNPLQRICHINFFVKSCTFIQSEIIGFSFLLFLCINEI